MARFGDLEAAIMDVVWSAGGPVRVREVSEQLNRNRPLAFNTVQTVMENLYRKGWLGRQKEGRAYRYEPIVSAEEYSAGLMRQALAASTDRPAALMHFIEELSAEEAGALEEAYRRLTGQRWPAGGAGRGGAR